MLKYLKKAVAKPPVNTSRIFLRKFAEEAAAVGRDKSFRVLDAGAGDAPYRHLFEHVTYETADLGVYEKDYARLDYVCDIADMPMSDATFDLVFCSQVLEHTKTPVQVLTEIGRVLKPGGEAWLSAPLFFEEHEKPYDFFRYTQFGWQMMAEEAGLEIKAIDWLEGYFGTLAYQMHMASKSLPKKMIFSRVLMLHSARRFARRDLKERVTDRGMCKNYRLTMVKPSKQATTSLPSV